MPQFHGRIDEKFAEWETGCEALAGWKTVTDWDHGCIGEGLHGLPKIIVKTKLGTQDVAQFTVDNIIKCLKDNGYGEVPEELGQVALDNYFGHETRQG